MKKIVSSQLDIYKDNYLKFGDTPEGVRNNDKETQYLRFEKVLKHFDITKSFSLHDIGCGTCALHKYLLYKKIKHVYHGSELVEEMILDSRKKYPHTKLFKRDILKEKKVEKCDVVLSSGTLYIKGKTAKKDWESYTYKMLQRMFELSNYGISFNMLTSYNTFESPELAYFNPQSVLDFCIKNLSRYVVIDHAYPLYEYTVTVFQPTYIHSKYPDKAFSKYYKNDR